MRATRSIWSVLAISALASVSTQALGATPVPRIKPEAPESRFISSSDEARLRSVFYNLGRRDMTAARTAQQAIKDEVAKDLAEWAYLRRQGDDASPLAISAFLEKNPTWPNASNLQRNAEKHLTGLSPDQIIAFYDERDPISGEGHLALAYAFLEKGNLDAGRAQLRTAWIDYNWSAQNERDILSRFGGYLNEDDHWAKVDRQLFDIVATATQRLVPLLSRDRIAEAEARIALLRQEGDAEAAFANLPAAKQRDAGVLHSVVRYQRRRGNYLEATKLAGLAPISAAELRSPERWFFERAYLAREALKAGRFEDAYVLSAYSGLSEGGEFADAEFMAGWVALRFLNDPERAKAHFAYLSANVTSPISRSRGEYWLGRAFEAANDRASAQRHYRVAAEYPFAYYGQLAIEALGPNAPLVEFPEKPEVSAEARSIFENRSLVRAMRMLTEVDEHLNFDRFARALDDEIESEGEVILYHNLTVGERKTYLAVRGAKVARNNGADVPAMIYPEILVPDAAAQFAEKPLILGLSRQESEFNPRAFSRAKARGLMQLLASTARLTARKEGLPYDTARLMDDPNYNLVIGAAHLSHLVEDFDGSYVMVLAGYNAGPHRVKQWIETYGDPRTPQVDPVDWVELIPFSETRNYVQRVLENVQAYRGRLDGVPLGTRLLEDISRGSRGPVSVGVTPPAPKLMQVSADRPIVGANVLNRPAVRTAAASAFSQMTFPPLHTSSVGKKDGK